MVCLSVSLSVPGEAKTESVCVAVFFLSFFLPPLAGNSRRRDRL